MRAKWHVDNGFLITPKFGSSFHWKLKEGVVFLEFSCHLQVSPIWFLWIIHHLQMEPRPSIANIKLLKARPWSNIYKSVRSNWKGIKCLVRIRLILNPCLEIFYNRDFRFIPSCHKFIWVYSWKAGDKREKQMKSLVFKHPCATDLGTVPTNYLCHIRQTS